MASLFLCWVDNKTNAYLYPAFSSEADILPWILKYGMPLAAGLMLAGILAGTIILKFGRKAGWTLWAIWMIGCFTLPRLMDAAPHSPAYKVRTAIQHFIQLFPSFIWVGAAAAAMILCVIISWLLLRKQQVNS